MEGARDAWEGMPLPPLRGDGHLVNFDDVFACAGGMGAPVRVHFTLACRGAPLFLTRGALLPRLVVGGCRSRRLHEREVRPAHVA